MNQSKSRRTPTVAAVTPTRWAPLPATLTESATAPAGIADDGQVHLGGQAPMFRHDAVVDAGRVRLGGQAPMFAPPTFLPDEIADAGLVRLGGQSPTF